MLYGVEQLKDQKINSSLRRNTTAYGQRYRHLNKLPHMLLISKSTAINREFATIMSGWFALILSIIRSDASVRLFIYETQSVHKGIQCHAEKKEPLQTVATNMEAQNSLECHWMVSICFHSNNLFWWPPTEILFTVSNFASNSHQSISRLLS